MPDWDAHEGLRAQVLWHSSSNFTVLGGHLPISASLPSGLSGVRRARDSLSELLLRVGCYPTCDFGSTYLPIVDQRIVGPRRYRPDAIYVGLLECAGDISPWCLPLPLASFEANAMFMRTRCDRRWQENLASLSA